MGETSQNDTPSPKHRMLRPSGGFRSLRSFQMAEIVFDATVAFCERRRDLSPRYREQMVQAARSGRQNIAEGSCASATSAKSEVLLTNVARGSLEELLLDYEDFLRHHEMAQWDKEDKEALDVREVCTKQGPNIANYRAWLEHDDPAIVVNALICVCNQAVYLLRRQVLSLETRHVDEGGYSEQLHAARLARREAQKTAPDAPPCPTCGKPMVPRTARQGEHAGRAFWGCSGFPKCRGTQPIVKKS